MSEEKKVRNGFFLRLNEFENCNVYFRQFNDRVVKCYLNFDFDYDEPIVGIAKCAPEDKFDYEIGKEVAFDKAIEKFSVRQHRIGDRIKRDMSKNTFQTVRCLERRMGKFQRKGR